MLISVDELLKKQSERIQVKNAQPLIFGEISKIDIMFNKIIESAT